MERDSNAAAPYWRKLAFGAVAATVAIVFLEGIVSFGLFSYDLARESKSPPRWVDPELDHVQFDEMLGWSNVPGAELVDHYSSGRSVHIDRLGFRGTRDFEVEVPPGSIRIVASGDSFTFGHGVDDRETFGAQLERLDPRVQFVNMGMNGYGLDQAYVWYERDGRQLKHDVHLVCLGINILLRMQQDDYAGYGKPQLRVVANELEVENLPIRRRGRVGSWLNVNFDLVRRLRMVQLGHRLAATQPAATQAPDSPQRIAQTMRTAARAIQEMARGDARHGSRLVVVWLPVAGSVENDSFDRSRQQLIAYLASGGIPTIDLLPDFRRLTPQTLDTLFIREGDESYGHATGHYTVDGNKLVANLIHARLQTYGLLEPGSGR